jgi:hypothetical protein
MEADMTDQDNAAHVANVANVAMASLVKLVGLLSAEMVAGKHRDDIDLLENAVRRKCFATVSGASAEATAEGVAAAHRLLDPVFRDLRARVALLARQQEAAAPKPAAQSPRREPPRARLN